MTVARRVFQAQGIADLNLIIRGIAYSVSALAIQACQRNASIGIVSVRYGILSFLVRLGIFGFLNRSCIFLGGGGFLLLGNQSKLHACGEARSRNSVNVGLVRFQSLGGGRLKRNLFKLIAFIGLNSELEIFASGNSKIGGRSGYCLILGAFDFDGSVIELEGDLVLGGFI